MQTQTFIKLNILFTGSMNVGFFALKNSNAALICGIPL